MTDQQHPGGVAGKLINEIRVHYQAAETSSEAQSYGNQIAGLVVLQDELSREARAILAELANDPPRITYGQDVKEIATVELRDAFNRLGLTLEDAE